MKLEDITFVLLLVLESIGDNHINYCRRALELWKGKIPTWMTCILRTPTSQNKTAILEERCRPNDDPSRIQRVCYGRQRSQDDGKAWATLFFGETNPPRWTNEEVTQNAAFSGLVSPVSAGYTQEHGVFPLRATSASSPACTRLGCKTCMKMEARGRE